MKRMFAALAVCAIFGAGYLAGSISPIPTAHAQIGGAGMWPAAAAAPASASGVTHFYAIDTGTRTLIACTHGQGKPVCTREALPQ